MSDNFINPKDLNRVISLIEFDEAEQPILENIDYELVRGAYCGDVISDIGDISNFGYSVKLNDSGTKFKLQLYKGVNHSTDQNVIYK